jgi:hypothetical protein
LHGLIGVFVPVVHDEAVHVRRFDVLRRAQSRDEAPRRTVPAKRVLDLRVAEPADVPGRRVLRGEVEEQLEEPDGGVDGDLAVERQPQGFRM